MPPVPVAVQVPEQVTVSEIAGAAGGPGVDGGADVEACASAGEDSGEEHAGGDEGCNDEDTRGLSS